MDVNINWHILAMSSKTHINFYLYQSPKKKRGHPWNRAGNCKTTQWIGPPEFIKSRYWMVRKATGKAIKGQNHEIVDILEYIFAQIWSVLQTVELVLHGAWPRVEQSGSKGFFYHNRTWVHHRRMRDTNVRVIGVQNCLVTVSRIFIIKSQPQDIFKI